MSKAEELATKIQEEADQRRRSRLVAYKIPRGVAQQTGKVQARGHEWGHWINLKGTVAPFGVGRAARTKAGKELHRIGLEWAVTAAYEDILDLVASNTDITAIGLMQQLTKRWAEEAECTQRDSELTVVRMVAWMVAAGALVRLRDRSIKQSPAVLQLTEAAAAAMWCAESGPVPTLRWPGKVQEMDYSRCLAPVPSEIKEVQEGIAETEWQIGPYLRAHALTCDIVDKDGGELPQGMAVAVTKRFALLLDGDTFKIGQYLDSRGRSYANTTCGITNQGMDFQKALLEPAKGVEQTEAAMGEWLRYIQDIAGVEVSEDEVIQMGASPTTTRGRWESFDEPNSFISNAIRYQRCHRNPRQLIHALIPIDGRCSGLQHYSLLTREPGIADRLGLVPDEADLDIYEYVAERASATYEGEAKGLFVRKSCKRPVMTYPYNAVENTVKNQLKEYVKPKTLDEWKEVMDAGKHLYETIQGLMGHIAVARDWINECGKIIADTGTDTILWVTPDGFTAGMGLTKPRTREIRANWPGVKSRLKIDAIDIVADKGRAGRALAPNYIHSMDATHLRMVQREAKSRGMVMSYIFDSFATTPDRMDELREITKETMIKLYSTNRMEELREQWQVRYGVELPDPPTLGALDIGGLRDSKPFA